MELPNGFIEQLQRAKESIENFKIQMEPLFDKIAEGFNIYIEGAPKHYYELSKYGWYLDMDITPRETHELGEMLRQSNISETDKMLVEYYSPKIRDIEKKLSYNNISRAKLISEGFQNHKSRKYFSSITLLLTQADGICYDRTHKFFFKNNAKLSKQKIYRPEIEEELMKSSDQLFNLILSPISKATAINEHSGKVKNFPVRLNRHEILHGIDCEYGTKTNSLKIISFLNYLDDIINYDKI